jgi:hypothetical protein
MFAAPDIVSIAMVGEYNREATERLGQGHLHALSLSCAPGSFRALVADYTPCQRREDMRRGDEISTYSMFYFLVCFVHGFGDRVTIGDDDVVLHGLTDGDAPH